MRSSELCQRKLAQQTSLRPQGVKAKCSHQAMPMLQICEQMNDCYCSKPLFWEFVFQPQIIKTIPLVMGAAKRRRKPQWKWQASTRGANSLIFPASCFLRSITPFGYHLESDRASQLILVHDSRWCRWAFRLQTQGLSPESGEEGRNGMQF